MADTCYVKEKAIKLKRNIMIGAQTNLTVPSRKKREVYPEKVFELATNCWMTKATIPEPEKHRRPLSAQGDGAETLPARLQTLTDDKAYDQFCEHYRDKVRTVMTEKAEKIKPKYRSDTVYNRKVLESLDQSKERFPGKTWFLQRKPKETRINIKHTTGLCHSSQLNYATLLCTSKQLCHCRTDRCGNWLCICEEEESCTCSRICSCSDCQNCQVGLAIFINMLYLRFALFGD